MLELEPSTVYIVGKDVTERHCCVFFIFVFMFKSVLLYIYFESVLEKRRNFVATDIVAGVQFVFISQQCHCVSVRSIVFHVL